MPEFREPFAGLALERKRTDEKLVRSICYGMTAEYEVVQRTGKKRLFSDELHHTHHCQKCETGSQEKR